MFNKNKKSKKNKGFTLIELLIVMLIIGIVGAISIPMYMHAMEKSRATEPIGLLNTIANAEQRYKISTMEYTNQLPDLDIHIEPYTQGNMTPSTFDTEYFDFTLEEEKAIAVRKDGGDYTLAVEYETGEVTCTPGESRICTSLNLKAGEAAVEPEPEPEPDPWKETSCPTSEYDAFYMSDSPYYDEWSWNYYQYDGPTINNPWWNSYYDNTLDCIVGEGNFVEKFRDSSCLDSTTCEEYEITDQGLQKDRIWWWDQNSNEKYVNSYTKRTCNKEAGEVECDEWTEVTEVQYDEDNTYATIIKTCTGDNINQADGSCLYYDNIYAVGGMHSSNYARCNWWDEYDNYCYDWTIYDNNQGIECWGDSYQLQNMDCYSMMAGCMYYNPETGMCEGGYWDSCAYYDPEFGCQGGYVGGMGNPCDWDGVPWGEQRSYECCSYDAYYDYEGCRWYRCDYWGEC